MLFSLFLMKIFFRITRTFISVVEHMGIDTGGMGFDSRAGQIGHIVVNPAKFRQSCVAHEGATLGRWTSPLVTRFVEILRV